MGDKVQHQLKELEERGKRKILPGKPRLMVGMATCGISTGSGEVFRALQENLEKRGFDAMLVPTGCIGLCSEEPLVSLHLPGHPVVFFGKVRPEDALLLVRGASSGKIPLEKAVFRVDSWDHVTGEVSYGKGLQDVVSIWETPFFKFQKRVVMRNCGLINPEDIDEYIAVGGYRAAWKALTEMTPREVIEEISRSGLRGRGGAGFSTARKWQIAAEAPGEKRFVICNADEGDPGAYMNRNEIESDPHSLIEGMIIGAYAVGAQEGIVYVRAEYPLAVKRLRHAISQAEEAGILGDSVLGTDFRFRVHLVRGAGSFVCGEETALISSIEGHIGRPRPRPPFPAEKGLDGMPTVINNVETWFNVPVIIHLGGDRFSLWGRYGNTGTKVFSLVGGVKRAGLAEIPLGTTISTLIWEIGGGAGMGYREVKAVQIGGPSGGCIPSSLFDVPVDYESLQGVGSIMGSGGLVAMTEGTCMVEAARYFLDFTSNESCGKCVPCREGLRHMLRILENITERRGKPQDIQDLQDLAETVKATSLCGLGRTATNPVLTTLRYFQEEYKAHIEDGRCPAGTCPSLIKVLIDAERCTGCGACMTTCPVGAIRGEKKKAFRIDEKTCTRCRACVRRCPEKAILVR